MGFRVRDAQFRMKSLIWRPRIDKLTSSLAPNHASMIFRPTIQCRWTNTWWPKSPPTSSLVRHGEILQMIREGDFNLVGGWGVLLALEKLRELGEIIYRGYFAWPRSCEIFRVQLSQFCFHATTEGKHLHYWIQDAGRNERGRQGSWTDAGYCFFATSCNQRPSCQVDWCQNVLWVGDLRKEYDGGRAGSPSAAEDVQEGKLLRIELERKYSQVDQSSRGNGRHRNNKPTGDSAKQFQLMLAQRFTLSTQQRLESM